MNSRKPLHHTLSNLNDIHYDRTSIDFATSIGINDALTHIYGRSIHILDLEYYISKSPALEDDCSLAIFCAKNIKEFIPNDNEELKKPIVIFWKVKNNQLSKYDPKNSGNWSWQNLVILPKNHLLIDETWLENPSELIFSSDFSGNRLNLPTLLKYLLKRETKYEAPFGMSSFGGYILDTVDISIRVHRNPNESGLWCIFSIIMLISNGNCEFAQEIREDDLDICYKVRAALKKFGINLYKNCNDTEPTCALKLTWINSISEIVSEDLTNEFLAWDDQRLDKNLPPLKGLII